FRPRLRIIQTPMKNLASAGRDKAVGLEMFRQCHPIRLRRAEAGRILPDAGGRWIASGEQRSAGRVAERKLAIGAIEANGARGKTVHVGSLDLRSAIAADFRTPVV